MIMPHRTTKPKKPCDFVFRYEMGMGWGVYPRILGWNVVLQGFLGWKTKIRENNSKPKEKNVRKDCAPKAPENFGFRQDFWIGIIK